MLSGLNLNNITVCGNFTYYSIILQKKYPDLYYIYSLLNKYNCIQTFTNEKEFRLVIKPLLEFRRVLGRYVNHSLGNGLFYPDCNNRTFEYLRLFFNAIYDRELMFIIDAADSGLAEKQILNYNASSKSPKHVLITSAAKGDTFCSVQWHLSSKGVFTVPQITQFQAMFERLTRSHYTFYLGELYSYLQYYKNPLDNPQIYVGTDLIKQKLSLFYPLAFHAKDGREFGNILVDEEFLSKNFQHPFHQIDFLPPSNYFDPPRSYNLRGFYFIPSKNKKELSDSIRKFSHEINSYENFPNVKGYVLKFKNFCQIFAKKLGLDSYWDFSFSTDNWVDVNYEVPLPFVKLFDVFQLHYDVTPEIYPYVLKLSFFLLFDIPFETISKALSSSVQEIQRKYKW